MPEWSATASFSHIRPRRSVPTADLVRNLEGHVCGEPLSPLHVEQKLSGRFRLLGTQGLVGIALAAIDMAIWDALARTHATSLVQLRGAATKPIRAYGPVGYDGPKRRHSGRELG